MATREDSTTTAPIIDMSVNTEHPSKDPLHLLTVISRKGSHYTSMKESEGTSIDRKQRLVFQKTDNPIHKDFDIHSGVKPRGLSILILI